MSDAKSADAAPPKKKGKLFLFIGIGVLVLVLGGAAAFMLMKKPADEDLEDGEDAVETEKPAKKGKAEKKGPPVFVKLDAFTVRLQNEGGDSYLQAVPELRVLDPQVAEEVKVYTPEIRHKALLVIAAKQPGDVNNPAGVQKLANELRVTINAILSPPPKNKKKKQEEAEEISDVAEPDDPVQAVLFTSFIVQ
ncbi:MAG: flagellar basal body-associated FliL family protein [Rhodocyclaceae bacterium]|jgi:flagellar FliL protein|nr:flagellar basal body-associated FliL family protein [Rhodocyclaceae bacterium]